MAEDPQHAHSHRGVRAVQHLVEHAPSTGRLALWAHHQDMALEVSGVYRPDSLSGSTAVRATVSTSVNTDVSTPGSTPITTDGHTLRYAPAFEKLPLPLQAGWVAHEVLRIALRHAQRFADMQQRQGDADLALFNTCADAIVNSTLAHQPWLQLPAGALMLETLLARVLGLDLAPEAALAAWDAEHLYRAIDDRRAPTGNARNHDRQGGDMAAPNRRENGPRAASTRALGAAHASDMLPHANTQQAPEQAPEAQAEEAREWAERLQRAHANDGAFSMLRTLPADLPRSRTPWEQSLRVQLARGLAPKQSLSWSRPTRSYLANQGRAGRRRRMPWEPGHSATTPMPRLVVVVDVSGSIDDGLMARFAREIQALTRRLDAGLVLVLGDDVVRQVLHFKPGDASLQGIVFKGGGGTDFTPLLQEAERHRPDLTVVLTDLDGPALFRPRTPVLWAVPAAHAHQPQPFGRKLVLS